MNKNDAEWDWKNNWGVNWGRGVIRGRIGTNGTRIFVGGLVMVVEDVFRSLRVVRCGGKAVPPGFCFFVVGWVPRMGKC